MMPTPWLHQSPAAAAGCAVGKTARQSTPGILANRRPVLLLLACHQLLLDLSDPGQCKDCLHWAVAWMRKGINQIAKFIL
jgi:hypothetical protein